MTYGKTWLESNTIQFFGLVLVGGGIDIITELLQKDTLDWRSVALALVSIIGIALRLKTKKPIVSE